MSPGGAPRDVGEAAARSRRPSTRSRAARRSSPSAAPTRTDFFGWFDDFSTTGAGFDALGALSRAAADRVRREPAAADASARSGRTSSSAARAAPRRRRPTARTCSAPRSARSSTATEAHRRGERADEARALDRARAGRRAPRRCSPDRRLDDGDDAAREYKILFDNAFGLVEGGDFRVGGVNARADEQVLDRQEGRPGATAEVTAEINEPGFDDLREDATCEIKPQSLIGEYYVDCQPGTSDEQARGRRHDPGRADRARRSRRTWSTTSCARPYRERLRLIISELGTGLAGRPEDLAGGAASAPTRACARPAGAADPRRPEPDHRALHRRRRHGGRRARGATSTTSSRWVVRDRRDRRDLGHAARGHAAQLRAAARPSSTSCDPTMVAPRRAGRRADPAARRPRRRGRPT